MAQRLPPKNHSKRFFAVQGSDCTGRQKCHPENNRTLPKGSALLEFPLSIRIIDQDMKQFFQYPI